MKRFVVVWAGQLVSQLGSGLTAFALAVWVYQKTGSVADLTLIATAAYLPLVVVAPLGGVLADRYDRRRVMLLADLGSAVATAVLLVAAFAGSLEPWLAALLVAASASCNAIQWPAYEAAIVTLVPVEQLGRASGLCELARGGAQLLAPAAGGALYAGLGLTGIAALDVASFACGVVALVAVRFPPHARGERTMGTWVGELREAWRLVARRAGLVAMLVLFAITSFTFAVVDLLFRPLVLAHGSPWELGALLSTVGAGMVVGAIVMAAWGGPRRKAAAILAFQLVEGGALVAAGSSRAFAVLCVAAFAYGLVIPLTFGCARTIWQLAVPDALQGRVVALRNALVMLAIPVGYAAASPLARVLAPADVIVAMGVVTCVAAVAVFGYAPYRRQAIAAVGAPG